MSRDRLISIGSRYLLVGLFIFALLSNVRLIIRNYHLHERINTTKAEVEALELRNQKLSLLMNYYQSSSYQEVEARRRLGVKRPDESAYIIKGINAPTISDAEATTAAVVDQNSQSNAVKWWNYLRGK